MNQVKITNHFCSWSSANNIYHLAYRDNDDWHLYEFCEGSYPENMTIHAGVLKISPAPANSTDVITFWGKQLRVINKMASDESIDPEIPEDFDRMLIDGILARLGDKKAEADYYSQLALYNSKEALKTTDTGHREGTW